MNRVAVLFLCLAAGCGLTPLPLHARIGDTPMEIAKRYGTAKVAGEQLLCTVTLKEVAYQAQIFFDAKGYVSMEIFSRKNPDPDDSSNDLAELTQADFDILLGEEESAVPWRKANATASTTAQQTWVSGNNRAIARYQPSNRLFLFLSPSAQPFIPATEMKLEGQKALKP